MIRYPLLLLAIFGVLGSAAAAQPPDPGPPVPPVDTVVAFGQSMTRGVPDVAYVTVVAESRAGAPREAQRQNAVTMAAVPQRLKAAGIADAAMKTLGIDLQPDYDYANGRQTLRGYVARNTLEIRVDEVEKAPEVIDAAVAAGASRVEGLRFDLKRRADLEREALTAAVQDAMKRAAAMAAGAGRSLGEILRIEDARAPATVEPRMLRAVRVAGNVADAPPETPIQAGELELAARVTVVVRLR